MEQTDPTYEPLKMDPEMRAQVTEIAQVFATSRRLVAAVDAVLEGRPDHAYGPLIHILRGPKVRPMWDVCLAANCLPYAVTTPDRAREAGRVLVEACWRRFRRPAVVIPPAVYVATGLGLFIRFIVKMGREMKMAELPFYIAIAAFPLIWYVVARLLPVNRQRLKLTCLGALADLEAPEGLALAIQCLSRSSSSEVRKAARALLRAAGAGAWPEDYDRVGPHVMSLLAKRAADKRDWDLVQVVRAMGRGESIAAMERLLRKTEPGRRRQMAQAALDAARVRADETAASGQR
ncbi:MAG: hypothetical protein NT029_02080 [Armatimonadetes bacterium]|nr:hypothetical protein [Armatimonadota bacterium]